MSERCVFSGSISLGLVSIPVKATKTRRRKQVNFNNLCPLGHKLEYKRWCPVCNREIPYSEITKGYKVGKQYIQLDKQTLESLKEASSKTIEVLGFRRLDDVDFRSFDEPYYLLPNEVTKPYVLFREILKLSGMCAVCRYTIRNKTHLGLIRTFKNCLVLQNLYYPDEILPVPEIESEATISKQELDIGLQLVKQYSEIDEKMLVDTFREKLEKIIEAKMMGKPIEVEVRKEEKSQDDLLEALKQSLKKKV